MNTLSPIPRAKPQPEGQHLPTPMLRLISGNPAIAMSLPDRVVQGMADELLGRRAFDKVDAALARQTRRADAICDAFRANFIITGKANNIWPVDSIADVITDDMKTRGWRDCTRRDVAKVLDAIDRDPWIPLALITKTTRGRTHTYMQGVRAQGAAV